MANVSCEHIELDKNGVARIAGSRIKVNHLVLIKRIDNATPEQIQQSLPHLTMAEIHAAFAYYYDHQAEIERDITFANEMREQAGPSPIAAKLRAMGKLP
ncbi:MAG TPA: DUF433 domain-containing protein [Pirellulales bacterium]|jgi:uncharacterized protein (DUF433 family)|nr:DUF433 domain-containing protein [Pirellulales bacterium]